MNDCQHVNTIHGWMYLPWTHHASKLLVVLVGKAMNTRITFHLNEVHECSVSVGMSASGYLHFLVHTNKLSAIKTLLVWHEETVVFLSVWFWAVYQSWYHDGTWTLWSVAHSTWNVVILDCFRAQTSINIIFSSIKCYRLVLLTWK